ncbi:DedA family protein [Flavobacterium columnare]|uniref:Membrane-associated protein n=1 Tax=Flavobacterium columnare (strain ATCC 49512 / CIP 103533 / TG 44/87) TaxID=1041826 RepID=G8X8V6_FLACA|nr:DedA family protein [Flavobacterium columnare]AEW87189.2 membrane-associated protein [Flavobacterium columnare ATCC 49512]MBF6654966.1 DedA family protein [Flavobacterium columnare]MBF6658192.1 DedA family protein [Flavobacterium columnare]PTD15735.1 DedA family protein [Flavobacterium columnare]
MKEFNWLQLLNPEFYILLEFGGIKIGLIVVLFIVFAETGLLAGFFLPGDSLLFLAGIYSETLMSQTSLGNDFMNVSVFAFLVGLMGLIGNMTGYWFGAKSGNYLYNQKDTFFFKKKYLYQAREFFDKYGNRAIVFARFLPIVRTFAPVVAGIVEMDKKKFMFYNILGSFLWAFSMIFAGHYLHTLFLQSFGIDLKHYIEFIVIGIVAFTTLPILWKIFKKKVHIE